MAHHNDLAVAEIIDYGPPFIKYLSMRTSQDLNLPRRPITLFRSFRTGFVFANFIFPLLQLEFIGPSLRLFSLHQTRTRTRRVKENLREVGVRRCIAHLLYIFFFDTHRVTASWRCGSVVELSWRLAANRNQSIKNSRHFRSATRTQGRFLFESKRYRTPKAATGSGTGPGHYGKADGIETEGVDRVLTIRVITDRSIWVTISYIGRWRR